MQRHYDLVATTAQGTGQDHFSFENNRTFGYIWT